MAVIELFNLYVGDRRPRLSEVRIGPFIVRLLDDYEAAVRQIPHGRTNVDQYDFEKHEWVAIERRPAVAGTWAATAIVTAETGGEKSVLLDEPLDDGGIWDLCSLLTFLTGRRVAIKEDLDRFTPLPSSSIACFRQATLQTCATAWKTRERLLKDDLWLALMLHNAALSDNLLQTAAALHFAALNIILDRVPGRRLSKEKEAELIAAVDAAVDASGLEGDEPNAMRRLLTARVRDGLGSLNDKLSTLLTDRKIISDDDRKSHGATIASTAKHVIEVRNRLTHTGSIPRLRPLSEPQALQRTIDVVFGVVPDLVRLVIGECFTFEEGEPGMWPLRDDLREFFMHGRWREPPSTRPAEAPEQTREQIAR
jgi:hypothetical protein